VADPNRTLTTGEQRTLLTGIEVQMRFGAYQLNKYILTEERKGAAHELFFEREENNYFMYCNPCEGAWRRER